MKVQLSELRYKIILISLLNNNLRIIVNRIESNYIIEGKRIECFLIELYNLKTLKIKATLNLRCLHQYF